jgi:hypothetical protein
MAEIQLFPKGKYLFDKFNNLVLIGNKNEIREPYEFCLNEPSLKTAAILLYGEVDFVDPDIKSVYIGKIKDEFITVGDKKVVKDTTVYIFVIPGKTLIPQTTLINGEPSIQSGHTLALFKGKDNQPYFLVVHDPSKPVLTLPGGTLATEDNGDRCETAKRKARVDTNLIDLVFNTPLKSFCKMTFNNTLFGISHIPDVAEFFVTDINNPFSDEEFVESDGCYARKIETLKTNLLLGLPVNDCVAPDISDLMKNSKLSHKQWQKNKLSRILNFVLFGYHQNKNQTYKSKDIAYLEMLFTPCFEFESI